MVLRVGDRVGQREDEIEVRHAHRTVQIVAEHADIGLGEGRVDIDVAPVNFESAVAQHQAHLSLGAVEKSAFGELNDRPQCFDSLLVGMEQSDGRSNRCVHFCFNFVQNNE